MKKIEYFKTTFQKNEKEDKLILKKIEEYTDFGELKKAEYFDNYGKVVQTNFIDYNKNQKFIKSVSISKSDNSKIIQTAEYDSIKKTSEITAFVNDSVNYKMITYFEDNDYPIKQISIKKRKDTTEINYEYDFDHNGKIKLAVQKEKGNEKPMTTNLYKYENNNLIETSLKTEWVEMISETEWKEKRISKRTSYTILEDLKKKINNITEFDKLYNTINSKEFEDSKLNRELNFEYEFDGNGNWIKKKVSMKEHFINSNEFIPIYVETRKISYWK
ncbi:hypothetical protein MC378_15065 [Polaribacter sp. MSW13]|uniref:Uncharacterized protein n=1 Tax=Polaribacter marinus TaxID=2916838 RepID=A0A9X1VPP0_9FLAO|nr:hypothetical protein [Polaribacter marinus]MCI2230494.1 hypothetical protein [Polaribacter marinus]